MQLIIRSTKEMGNEIFGKRQLINFHEQKNIRGYIRS